MKIFISQKALDKYVEGKMQEIITTQRNSVLESAIYYIDLVKENKKLKQTVEEQAKILNAIKLLKEVLR